jgi:hypothetical protein
MHHNRILEMVAHLPRRIVREAIMVADLIVLFLANRFSRALVTRPGGAVVSLTTYKERCEKVYLAIESIARGEVRPSRMILWIDDADLLDNLPATIRRLQRRGLEVKSCNSYGPHKKYYPYLESQEEFDTPLVTADDDFIYPRYWLKKLVEANQKYPEIVNCFWAHVIAMNENGIGKYADWKQCVTTRPRFRNIIHSGIGTIYPPAFLEVLKRAGTAFEDCCPKGDDLWLHVQALRSGYKVRQILPRLPYFSFQGIPGTRQTALSYENVSYGDGNDRQIRATYTEADVRMLRTDCDIAPS